jgi:hypothetical protein
MHGINIIEISIFSGDTDFNHSSTDNIYDI